MALRQQVWVDRSVQGVLVGRVILYWGSAMLYVGIGSICFQYNQNPDWTLAKHVQVLYAQVWPWLPSAVFLLPLAIYDVVRMSNLFAGPVFRLRKHFAAMRQDIACAPIVFREDDYWRDLAEPINDMQAEILRLRAGVMELQNADADLTESAQHTDQVITKRAKGLSVRLTSKKCHFFPLITDRKLVPQSLGHQASLANGSAIGP